MASLSDAYGGGADEATQLVRLMLGVSVVITGGATGGLVLLWTVSGDATQLGAVGGLLAKLGTTLAFGAVAFSIVRHGRSVGRAAPVPTVVGCILVGLAVLTLWSSASGASLWVVVLATFSVGVLLLVGGHPTALEGLGTGRVSGVVDRVAYRRGGSSGRRVLPTDGGRSRDGELSFPLDRD